MQKYLVTDDHPIPSELEAFLTAHNISEMGSVIRNLQGIYTILAQEYTRQHTLLDEQVIALRAEATRLEDEIRNREARVPAFSRARDERYSA